MTGPILLTAWLNSPLAGDAPQLDALLEWALSPFQEVFQAKQRTGVPHYRIDRKYPAPAHGTIPIPLAREHLGSWLVSKCSSPILPLSLAETVEHVNKRIAVELAGLLDPDERRIVSTSNSWTKSYRIPLRIRVVPCVRWFCVANERSLKKGLRHIHAIGKKVADGYGRVREWATEPAEKDWSWFAKHESGTVLMRPLPLEIDGCDWLPVDLIGNRRHFGSCSSPYWHSDRFTDIVIPA